MMQCACCGNHIEGHYQQWYNRDRGYGVCRECVDWQIGKGVSAEEIHENYGVEGVNYPAKKDQS